ncbi:Uncharacterised protein [Yersinia enterocolitica]|nr:Uncharacterised protein [Yersinia enterocolitica]CNJ84457.1 Uncharacterised protein [Yersinia enterocolitica]CQD53914.1 Uncharacterised protein [Yersinia enterocolitica]CQH53931.1 Uncharacterised protein [Yersinia enterocolitica]CQH55310.1 Uncharacterised protein [Yersinia enterocolitica]
MSGGYYEIKNQRLIATLDLLNNLFTRLSYNFPGISF